MVCYHPRIASVSCGRAMSAALLEAVRGLHVADPDLGVKPLLARLRAQQPGLGADTKEVREALKALKALKTESEARAAAAATAAALHKKLGKRRVVLAEDGEAQQQRAREIAEEQAMSVAQAAEKSKP